MVKRDNVLFILVLLFFAVEIFIVQHYCTNISFERDVSYKISRLIIDLGWVLVIFSCVKKCAYPFVVFFTILFSFVVLSYSFEFRSPLFFTTILYQAREAAALLPDFWKILDKKLLIFLSFVFVTNVIVFDKYTFTLNRTSKRFMFILGVVILSGTTCWMNATAANFVIKLNKIAKADLFEHYGFLITWTAEKILLDESELLQTFPDRSLSNKITKKIGRLPSCSSIVVVQAESLDFEVLNLRLEDREVTPFLNQVIEDGCFCKIKAPHILGSASSDCMVLTQKPRSKHVLGYLLDGYDFTSPSTLVSMAKKNGYSCNFYHGYNGTFFNRRKALGKMGFAKILFEEDFPKGTRSTCLSRDCLLDGQLFDFMSSFVVENKKQLDFCITLTAHTPFTTLSLDKCKMLKEPVTLCDNYLNSINYFDSVLGKYVMASKTGTLFLIYGDHNSHVEVAGGESVFVPYILFEKTPDGVCSPVGQKGFVEGQYSLEDVAENIGSIFR